LLAVGWKRGWWEGRQRKSPSSFVLHLCSNPGQKAVLNFSLKFQLT
jgi:hypothetical protein